MRRRMESGRRSKWSIEIESPPEHGSSGSGWILAVGSCCRSAFISSLLAKTQKHSTREIERRSGFYKERGREG
uniref:Uncharacterized protein n=1 Tax=Rhizophora mucronata TaxID=61149 RepID=A0A2P2N321_RHIMU